MSANERLILALVVLAAVAAGAAAWRRWAPASFWLWVGFPLCAVAVYLTWPHVAYGCKLTHKRHGVRLSLEAVPLASAASEITTFTQRRKLRRIPVDKAPRLGLMRPTSLGWRVRVRLHDGQIPADYTAVAERLAHAWRVHTVRVVEDKPGRVVLVVNRSDALAQVEGSPETGELLRVRPGMLETGAPWVMDFKVMPHWLNAGSTLINAVIRGLAPQPVALVGFDLKDGVELTPYAPRLSALATTRAESVGLLGGLVQILPGACPQSPLPSVIEAALHWTSSIRYRTGVRWCARRRPKICRTHGPTGASGAPAAGPGWPRAVGS